MIKINQTLKADTRMDKKPIEKDELLKDTKAHIEHVKLGCEFICNLLREQASRHDHTKLEFIDEFHTDFLAAQNGANFKDGDWWQIHLEERHHLNDRLPRDANLIDLIESIVDCCMAGKARSGEVYPYKIAPEALDRMVQNTIKLLVCNIEVEKKE